MKIGINLTIIFLLSSLGLSAQSTGKKMVSWNYKQQTIGYILNDISAEYDVKFSYSSEVIGTSRKVSSTVKDVPFNQGFKNLCNSAQLQYAHIGGQYVLKSEPIPTFHPKPKRKLETLTQLPKTKLPRRIEQLTPLYQEELPPSQVFAYNGVDPLNKNQVNTLAGGDRVIEMEVDRFKNLPDQFNQNNEEDYNRLAQVSILPRIGTNAAKSEKIVNNVSVNLFWGANGGVDGLEVGGIFNHIEKDVKGVQVAGIGNYVNEDVVGTQASGLLNMANGNVQGFQVSGLFNYAREASAIQVSGLFNITAQEFSGLQVAPIFNYAGPGGGVQLASIMNLNKGAVKTQISALMNVAGDVDYAQISPLINIAKKVDGFQFGLINVADTVSGVPFGLLNIVKKGYNRVDIFASESLIANVGLKLGARSFYNIFHLGARWDDENALDLNGNEVSENKMTWGLGYGIGTAVKVGPASLLNIEAVAIHINEKEAWTNDLNLLTQLRLFLELQLGRRTGMFIGPTGNIMFSNLYDADTDTYGSRVMPYNLYDETIEGTNTKAWVGFSGGIRF